MAEHFPHHPQYVPIIKWQKWEQCALDHLDADVVGGTLPCIEIRDSKQHGNLLAKLPAVWGRAALVDYADPNGRLTDQRRVELREFLAHATGAPAYLTPVINPLDAVAMADKALMKSLRTRQALAWRLRVTLNGDVAGTVAALAAVMPTLLQPEGGIRLILDMGVTPAAWSDAQLAVLGDGLKACADLGFTSIHLTSGAFPDSLQTVVSKATFVRRDWQLWQAANALVPELHVGFGDYGTLSPLWTEEVLTRRGGRANIRYTLATEWLVLRGGNITKEESVAISELMVTVHSASFEGPAFSFGDRLIAERADPTVPMSQKHCGQYHIAEAWSHHVTYVTRKQY